MLIFYFQIHKYMLLFIHIFLASSEAGYDIRMNKVGTDETENRQPGGSVFLSG